MKKRLLISCLVLGLAVAVWRLCVTEAQLYHAKGMMQTVDLLRDASLASTNVQTVIENLDYVVFRNLARPGDSGDETLNVLCASYASNAVAAIITHLKIITGQDLGADPEAWLKAYAHKKVSPSN